MLMLFLLFPLLLCCWLGSNQLSPPPPESAHPLNNIVSVLEAKEDLSNHEIPEQSCLFLRDLHAAVKAPRSTHMAT